MQRPRMGICLGEECGWNQISGVKGHLNHLEHCRILKYCPENCPLTTPWSKPNSTSEASTFATEHGWGGQGIETLLPLHWHTANY